jgi:hypothetical protein
MRFAKLVVVSSLLALNGSLLGAELISTNPQYPEVGVLHRPNSSSVASTTDWKGRLLAAEDSAGKCTVTCQEKRDSCFSQCKTSDNPKICQGDCLGAYKTCRSECAK